MAELQQIPYDTQPDADDPFWTQGETTPPKKAQFRQMQKGCLIIQVQVALM